MAAPGITARGSGGSVTGATSISFAPSGNFAPGSMGLLAFSMDNSHAGGVAQPSLTVTDTKGNTWSRKVSTVNNSASTADTGVEAAIWVTSQDGGTLTTSDTITVSWTTSAGSKTYILSEITGTGLSYSSSGSATANGSTAPAITTASLDADALLVGCLHTELGNATTVTGDADTTRGSWSAIARVTAGSGVSGSGTAVQSKSVTGTGTQSFDPTLNIGSDLVISWISFICAGPSGSVSKTLAAASAAASAVVAIAASLAITLGTAVASAAGGVAVVGTATATLAAASCSTSAEVACVGAASASLTAATGSSVGTVAVAGQCGGSTEGASLSCAGAIEVAGSASLSTSTATIEASGAVSGSSSTAGQCTATLESATLYAQGEGVTIQRRAIAVLGSRASYSLEGSTASYQLAGSGASYSLAGSLATHQLAGSRASYQIEGS